MSWAIEAASTGLFWLLAVPTFIAFMLFLASGITLFVWLNAWRALVFAGTPVIWLFLSGAYLWACVAWGEPYLRWYLGLIGRS